MAGITLEIAEAKLTFWLNVEEQLGMNAEVTIGDKTFKRHQLKDVSDQVAIWESRVARLSSSSSGSRFSYGVPK
jgi:hypothetical protein